MAEYTPPKYPRGTIFNQGDFLYLYAPLKYITNIGTGSKVYKETFEGTARLRTITSSHMTIAQNANEIDLASSGKFFAVNGTNTAPSYSFANDLNTGLHRPSADSLHMVCGGTDILQLNNVNGVVIPNGYNIYGTGRFTAQQQGTASSPIFRTDLGGVFHGMYFDNSTGAPTIASGSADIAEFSSTDITLYKTLSSGVQPLGIWRASSSISLTLATNVNLDYNTSITTQGTAITRSVVSSVARYILGEVGVYLVVYDFSTTTITSTGEQMMFNWANLNNSAGSGRRYGNTIYQIDNNAMGYQCSFIIKTSAITDYITFWGYRGGGTAGSFPNNTADNCFVYFYKLV